MSRRFDSVLVANRGEIAMRILRSARDAGYRTIAVYSEADADAPHVALADEAVLIGAPPASESYLDSARILDAARRTAAGAVHPGYGFLSENAAFAAACAAAGLVFIGPSAQAIELMGNKAAAKRRMLAAGVPCIPGYQEPEQSDAALTAAARSIGVPLMVKAAAGGGGRGMRLVEDFDALPSALAAARSEARKAFGSDELILEKAVLGPRHVEIQVFGDEHGNILHLGERDCSVQRRHQKVVEEAPCPVMDETLRAAMGAAAVAAARSIDYVGAGTVEFLLDRDGAFHFLEMNTRLQVEHPVTELVTGLDLVDLQLRIAQGDPLPFAQADVSLEGHAIEVRLYAENTAQDFLPASGVALDWEPPVGDGVRVDHGLVAGQQVSPYYDPMIAKIIAVGEDRATARRRLLRALRSTVILGLETNREFLIDVLDSDRFASGEATTAFIGMQYPAGFPAPEPDAQALALAALLLFLEAEERSLALRVCDDAQLTGASGGRAMATTFAFQCGDDRRAVMFRALGEDRYAAALPAGDVRLALVDAPQPGRLRVAVDGIQHSVAYVAMDHATVSFLWRGSTYTVSDELARAAIAAGAAASGAVIAPMHGCVVAVRVAVGDAVRAGDELAVMEAMKMEHRLTAQVDGVVRAIHVQPGDQIGAGAAVIDLDEGPA